MSKPVVSGCRPIVSWGALFLCGLQAISVVFIPFLFLVVGGDTGTVLLQIDGRENKHDTSGKRHLQLRRKCPSIS